MDYYHISQEHFKLQTTSDEKYWKTNKRMYLANEQFKWNRTMYASLSTD
jgi:hypothetical protein